MRNLRLGVRAPGNDEGGCRLASEEQRVLKSNPRHRVRRMGELVRGADVARRVDSVVGGAKPVVDLHAGLIELHSRGFEVQSLDVRCASNTHEDLVPNHFSVGCLPVEDDHLALGALLHPSSLDPQRLANALALELRRENCGCVGVFARQKSRASAQDEDLGSEAAEGLRQLAANGPGADDDEPLWKLGQ